MSVETWKARFYPKPAADTTREEAILHSLRKWVGLRKVNLDKHDMRSTSMTLYDLTGAYALSINGWSCALCVHYLDILLHDPCKHCPLGGCNDTCEDEFACYYQTGNPEPMIKILAEAYRREKFTL